MIYHARRSPTARLSPRRAVRQDPVLPRWLEVLIARFVRWTNYDDYLHSAVWRSKRQRALRRAEFACQMCNAKQRLEVHHREYPAILGTEPDNDLTVLCANCHRKYHGK